MSLTKYLKELWKRPKANLGDIYRARLIKWRQEPVLVKVGKPLRLDRAKALGYKAKQGYILVRQRLPRGGRKKEKIRSGRRPKRMSHRLDLSSNYQQVAEQRAAKRYANCEVLNSYYVAKDGKHYWYEVILVDTSHPAILADSRISWIASNKQHGRVFRGLTSAGRRSRGLRHKGKGAEKVRPSRNAVIAKRLKDKW